MRMIGFSRGLFAIASASLAMLSLVYGSSALVGQSVPAWMPRPDTWVYAAALVLLVASIGLCFPRTALPSTWTIGVYLAIWGLTCIPQIVSAPLGVGGWYGFCEALTSLVGAWVLYALLRDRSRPLQLPIGGERAMRAAYILFGITCVFYGWSHFIYADYTAGMVPTWLPGHLELAYCTGLAHIAAGVGLIFGVLPRLAATSEAIMMSLFGLLVWVPSFFARPRPEWATPPENQWSELVVNLVLAASAWIVATSLANRPWASRSRTRT